MISLLSARPFNTVTFYGKPPGQEKFIVEMEKIVTQKRTVRLVKDAGWYSESEMKNDLLWTPQLDSNKSCLEKDTVHTRDM